MVAYGFKKQFVEPIVKGTKTQTIRGNGKRRHARVGFAYADRNGDSNGARWIGDDLDAAFGTHAAIHRINYIRLGNRLVEDLDAFAQSDGFQSLSDMHAFWMEAHGKGCFEGTLIGWEAAS